MPTTQPIILVHIQKTAGMSLCTMIGRHFERDAIFKVEGSICQTQKQLAALSEADRANIQFIHGHIPFGLHLYLPNGARYITILRDPVDRIVSAYYYALRRPEWGIRQEILAHRISLSDFVNSELAVAFHNGQTRMLSGSEDPVNSASALETAKENLRQHFVMAGLMERFDESVLLCRALLGWRRVFYQRKNVNRYRAALEDIPRDTIADIERSNSLDLDLYEMARKRFDGLVLRDPTVQRDLDRFRRVNRLYSMFQTVREIPSNLLTEVTFSRVPSHGGFL